MKVTRELLPDHPIEALKAAETSPERGIHNGEVIAFHCIECGACDEDVREIIHEADCSLAGATKPTAYADRPRGPLRETGGARPARADGGSRDDDPRE